MKAVLHQAAPQISVVDLFVDAPTQNPICAAYLLAAYAAWFPPGTVFLAVVDPGVGGERPAVIVEADAKWFVGPGNGLLEIVRRRAVATRIYEVTWRPDLLSASFHGRDLFAPIAASLALGEPPRGEERPEQFNRLSRWPDDLAEVVYIDHYGNAMTGLRAASLRADSVLVAGRQRVRHARTFSSVEPGEAFWYENSNGLAEIAVNMGRASKTLMLFVGMPLQIEHE